MACHYLFLSNHKEFLEKLKQKDEDLITKMVKCVLSSIKRKRKSVNIFEITFRDQSNLVFSVNEKEYIPFLDTYMDDLISFEEYELCAEIMKIKNKPKRLTYKKTNTNI